MAPDGPIRQAGVAAVAAAPSRDRAPSAALLFAPLTTWLLLAFAAPLAIVILLSFQEQSSPFAPLVLELSGEQWRYLFDDPYYVGIVINTVLMGMTVAGLCVLLGYPVALWIAGLPPAWRAAGIAIVLIPLLTNVVIRTVGMLLLLAPHGFLNAALAWLGLPSGFNMLFTWGAIVASLVQVFMPFAIMALFDNLQSLDGRLKEAAAAHGGRPVRTFLDVTLPLSLPGIRAALIVTFLLASTSYVTATFLGGLKIWIAGMVVWSEALQVLNYRSAAAMAVALLLIGVAFTVALNLTTAALMPWTRPGRSRLPRLRLPTLGGPAMRAFDVALEAIGPWIGRLLLLVALALLVFPLVLVLVGSFNNVPEAFIAEWRGFTTRWYVKVFTDGLYSVPIANSFLLALSAALISVLLTVPAAYALVFLAPKGRELWFSGFMLPLALPGVAIAIGMLFLLQAFTAVPPFVGLLLVHVVLVSPFMLSMLRASLMQIDPALEQAGLSLGARRLESFLRVTLPLMRPSILVAGVIAFLVSFGEVTVTAFLTTARMQTLPVRMFADMGMVAEPTINAISTLVILGTMALLVLVNRFVRLDNVWHR
jgi:putative spermidine/putrescine transport system permease protein